MFSQCIKFYKKFHHPKFENNVVTPGLVNVKILKRYLKACF